MMGWLKWFGIYLLWGAFVIGLSWVFSLTSRLVLVHDWEWWQASMLLMIPLAGLGATAAWQIEQRLKRKDGAK